MSQAQRALAVSSAIRSVFFKALKQRTKRAVRATAKSVKSSGERNNAAAHRSKA